MGFLENTKGIIAKQIVNLALNASDENLIRGTKIADAFTKDGIVKDSARRIRKSIEEKDIGYQLIQNIKKDLSNTSKKKLIGNFLVNSLVVKRNVSNKIEKEQGFRPPYLMVIDVTDRCNLKCPGCWAANCKDIEDISLDLLNRIMKEAREMGIYFITLAGGEPFIRKDILDFFEQNDDMYFHVYTNGTCITKEMAKKLGEMGHVAPAISVEGMKEDTDKRRGEGV